METLERESLAPIEIRREEEERKRAQRQQMREQIPSFQIIVGSQETTPPMQNVRFVENYANLSLDHQPGDRNVKEMDNSPVIAYASLGERAETDHFTKKALNEFCDLAQAQKGGIQLAYSTPAGRQTAHQVADLMINTIEARGHRVQYTNQSLELLRAIPNNKERDSANDRTVRVTSDRTR
jgi:hypothetical protein